MALAIGRNDRRLRERDEIANSIGIPVLASVPVARPSAAAGWTNLLEDYKPSSVHAWQLRAALQQLDLARSAFGRPGYDGNGSSLYDDGLVSMVRSRRPLFLAPRAVPFLRSRCSRPRAATGRLCRLAEHPDVTRHRPATGHSRHGHPSHRVRHAGRAHRSAAACCELPPMTRAASTSNRTLPWSSWWRSWTAGRPRCPARCGPTPRS